MRSDFRQRSSADESSAAPGLTPEAAIGPFYPGVFVYNSRRMLAHRPRGQPIKLSGRFFDALGKPVPSVIIEIWQGAHRQRWRVLVGHHQAGSTSGGERDRTST